jgi:aminoglycoside 3-N-acetyltransferase
VESERTGLLAFHFCLDMVTKEDIIKGLRMLGLRPGDGVVVHSSLSSFGRVEGGADTVVDAILEVIGPEGTLVVPTFNYEPEVFDPQETPSVVGAITEAVRKRPNAIRSKHPTHSVAAIGRLADVIVEDHEKVHPFGRGSALFKLLQANGKILQLGTDMTTCSMVHVAEEIAEVPYLDRQRNVAIKLPNGQTVRRWVRRPGCSQGFGVLEDVLRERGQLIETTIGKCRARMCKARDLVQAALDMLRTDPESLLCKRPDCGSCAEARAMIAARQTEAQDREVTELSEQEEQTIRLIEKKFEDVTIEPFEIAKGDHQPN